MAFSPNTQRSSRLMLFMLVVTLGTCGGLLIYFTMEFLEQMTNADAPMTPDSMNQVGLLLLVVTMMAGIPAVGMGAYIMYIGARVRSTAQWPPSGMGFKSSEPVVLGSRANLIGFFVMFLGLALIVCGLVLPVLGWQIVSILDPDS